VNLPFFFPTRVLIIDDEPQVLRMTARLFGQRPEVSAVHTFERAADALAFLEAERALAPQIDAFGAARVTDELEETVADGGAGAPVVRRRVEIRVSDVSALLDAPRRGELVSTIFCDYAMPGLDGLAFFERLADVQIRRVLLTAICDERRAVQAFNRGLIHQFVQKADPSGPQGLESVLADQMRAFFRARTTHLAAALALGDSGRLLQHPALEGLLARLVDGRRWNAFAFSVAPPGYRLAGPGGEARLLLADAGMFEHAARVVAEIEGPEDLRAALRARTWMPTGRNGLPLYEAAEEWRDWAVAPAIEAAAEPLYWAVV